MSAAGDWDELLARAKESAQSGGTPASWGTKVELDVGEAFRGRHRGQEEGSRSGAYLLWDSDGNERFVWGCASLDREYTRERPSLGDDVAIVREENYRTRYDDRNDEPTGLSYGVATRENNEPLPGVDENSDLPY